MKHHLDLDRVACAVDDKFRSVRLGQLGLVWEARQENREDIPHVWVGFERASKSQHSLRGRANTCLCPGRKVGLEHTRVN